jgi:enamine deaminase RidA (YjgF/YER057c/UK114 family)
MEKIRIMPKDHWDWSMPVKFSQGWKVGNLIFVGGQISADAHGRTIGKDDIATQTRNVFEHIRSVLREVGADLKDVVRLNTYYHQRGQDADITRFWEEMTKVRMESLANPGPVGTAVRVAGFAYEDLLIEIEAIAALGPKTRLMPKNHWDWSMPVPFSQGWRVNDLIFVGGQISADRHGRTIGKDDIAAQTRNVFEFIRRVLQEGGADLKDIIKLNTYCCQPNRPEQHAQFWEELTNVFREYLADPGPVVTAVGVEGFAYEDLLIEIEAIAAFGPKTRLMPTKHWGRSMGFPLSPGWQVGDLIFVGEQLSLDEHGRTVAAGDILDQTRNSFRHMRQVLQEGGADLKDLVKLNTYYQYDAEGPSVTAFWEDMTRIRMEYLVEPGPSATAVRVAGFPHENLLIAIEGIAAVALR